MVVDWTLLFHTFRSNSLELHYWILVVTCCGVGDDDGGGGRAGSAGQEIYTYRGPQSTAPVRKSAPRSTKYCTCRTSRSTKVLRLPRNPHVEVHKVLRLPRNLPFKVHKVLRLPRSLRKVLRLPWDLHFKVHKALPLPRNPHVKVHKVLCLPRNLHFTVHKVLRLPRKLHIKIQITQPLPRRFAVIKSTSQDNIKMPKRSFRSRCPPISSRPKVTLHCTCHKIRAPAPAHQILRACAVEMRFENYEVNECTVNSSELAGHGCEHLRSGTRPKLVRTPSVGTLLEKTGWKIPLQRGL